MTTIPDQTQRQQALTPDQSFIVQAPAGSGKTELLTQRFLVLLSTVAHPEEIIALTFTRKAASEMRQRVMQALDSVKQAAPNSAHARQTWQLAQQVLEHDKLHNWQLCNNPNRLRIQTIDALCATLTRQMPILSRFGAQPEVTDHAFPYYREATRRLLSSLEDNAPWAEPLSQLLLHLDNNFERAERLFVAMLSQREQWMPYVLGAKHSDDLRRLLETNLQTIIEQTLQPLSSAIPTPLVDELITLIRNAALYLDGMQSPSVITACFGLQAMPACNASGIAQWLGICELLLTKQGTVRKQVNKTLGFPAASSFSNGDEKQFYKTCKQQMLALLDKLRELDSVSTLLLKIRECPPAAYDDKQWHCIEALLEILPLLVAQLTLVFREQSQVDFSEIQQQALHALGDDDAPTNLALALDYRIQHILIDEFQDTSMSQFRLLEKLTAGWQMGDGRSLFLVGDPMQSIYRFRAAEVGLFIKAQQEGVGDIPLEPLQLSSNFRSHAGIVDWVNQTFSAAFPNVTDITLGAVPYHPSNAVIPEQSYPAVSIDNCSDRFSQAQKVIEQIQQASGTIAILVKARNHLLDITQALQNAEIPYQAIEIEALCNRPIIQDLWALCRAILHPADRLAWLSILRAPWCGLSLADLHIISQTDNTQTLWTRMNDSQCKDCLSDDGQSRLNRFLTVLTLALSQFQRDSLRNLLEKIWLAFGGPACVESPQALVDAQTFFHLIEQEEEGASINDLHTFENKLWRLFASDTEQQSAAVQVMTIHKAKGLEFDTVIVPALERRAPHDHASLLLWAERPAEQGNQILLAPIHATSQEFDPIYQFLRRENSTKGRYELARLFYVAATRAKQRLHLLCSLETDEDGECKKPSESSLLAPLWSTLQKTIQPVISEPTSEHDLAGINHSSQASLQRLSINWQYPKEINHQLSLDDANNPIPRSGFLWSNNPAAAVGTLIHRQLCALSDHQQHTIETLRPRWQSALQALGVLSDDISCGLQQIEIALTNVLNDQRGRWIIDSQHQDAHSEYALTAKHNGQTQQIIIDRTFIDDAGVRWIIDYKTSQAKEDETLEQFLAHEKETYLPQLTQYATIMQMTEARETRLALYFPMHTAWLDLGEVHVTS